jgi:hypothetical protein
VGTYRIEIQSVGGHGCQREKKDGEFVIGCERSNCPDCMARELVRRLKRSGENVESATLTHWPGQPSEVKDDLLTGMRKGSF